MIVATVASWAEKSLDAWRYVGYKSYTHALMLSLHVLHVAISPT